MSRGHGWVTKNPDGFKARCGGPAMCMTCRREQIALVALARPQTPTRPAWYWVQDVHTYDVLVRDPSGTEYEITGNMLSDTPAAVQRVLNATLDALTKPPIEPPAPLVADLAALVHRLAYAVGKERANEALRDQAIAFLRSHGLEPEPLREGAPE